MPLTICSISDTHSRHRELTMPEADLLIVAGDITEHGTLEEVSDFNEWLGEIKSKYKKIYVVAGNHDFIFEHIKGELILSNAKYLEDDFSFYPSHEDWKKGNGYLIYGSPQTPWFGGWAFNVNRGDDIKKYWERIPDDVNILITHGPARGTLDSPFFVERINCSIPSNKNKRKRHVGCEELDSRILELDNLKTHIFGHIHHSYGQEVKDDVRYVNSSIAPHPYKKTNKPQVFTVK